MTARQGEKNDEGDQDQHADDEDAAFGARGTSAEDGFTHGVSSEEMVLGQEPAVWDAVEKGLCPIPRGVEADGPPERTGAPQAQAEDDADLSGGEQTDGRLAWVVSVARPKRMEKMIAEVQKPKASL